jgi:predicted RNase H-like nuclease
MEQITILGIDCATDDAKVGLSRAVAGKGRCVVHFAGTCSSEREVADEVASWLAGQTRALIAFDAPLGWPRPMGAALVAHSAGQPLAGDPNELFRRATDRFVKARVGKQSLDVGADRIARTAHSALKLLAAVRQKTRLPIPMAWEPRYSEQVAAIEVYPAATLMAHGIRDTGYKNKEKIAERKEIMGSLKRLVQLPKDKAEMEGSADALDAAVCVLAGYDFLRGEAYQPEKKELAVHEGWIWVRANQRIIRSS